MKKTLRPSALLPFSLFAVFTLLLALGCGKGRPPAEEEEHPSPVKAAPAEKKSFGEWTELVGTTMHLPGRGAFVSTLVEGRVQWLLGKSAASDSRHPAKSRPGDVPPVAEGQPVKVGQVLVVLDDRVARSHRDKAELALKDLKEKTKQAEYAVELAQIQVDSLEALKKSKAPTSPVELEKARVALKDAESKKRSIAIQEETAQEELKSLDEQLVYYELRAPLSGRLGMVQARLGQTLAIGAVVAEVMDLHEIDVLCFAPPHVAARLAERQPARLAEGVADAQKAVDGRVAFISVAAQPETGNLAVKVRFPNPELRLKASTVRRVQVLTQPVAERWTIPEEAVMEDQDPPGVVVVDDLEKKTKEGKQETLGKAHLLRAVLGVRDRERHCVEVLELFDPEKKTKHPVAEAKFIVEGGHGLQDGDRVKLEEEKDEKKDEK